MRLDTQSVPGKTIRNSLAVLAISCSGLALGQEPVPAAVDTASPGTVEILGVAEDRLNPTHGTVFFQVSNAFFPADPRDVAVIINDAQLPPGDLAVSRRIVSASYVVPDGASEIVLRAWDAAGQVLTATTRFWAGNLTILAQVTDFEGTLLDDAEVVATLQADPSVRSVARSRGGEVEILNVPPTGIVLNASHPSGLEGETTLQAGERRARLVLR